MFVEKGDNWVSNIRRSPNYEFKLTEKKIGSTLFALYRQATSTEFDVTIQKISIKPVKLF